MRLVFTQERYDYLKSIDLTGIPPRVLFDDQECALEVFDVRELLICLNDKIACEGMNDDYSAPNEHGAKLYAIYDDILNQRDQSL